MNTREQRVCVGIVTGAHGVRGAVRLKSFTAEPADVARYGPLEDEGGERRYKLRVTGTAKGVVIATIAGIGDRDQAEALRGLRLYLPRAALPPPGEEEYYHADLLGLTAALADGSVVGKVSAVHDFGAGDTLEIARPPRPPLLVPFTRAIVPIVDLAAGRLVIDPPPGLIDESASRSHPHPNPPPLAGEGISGSVPPPHRRKRGKPPPPQAGEGRGGGNRSPGRVGNGGKAVAAPESAA